MHCIRPTCNAQALHSTYTGDQNPPSDQPSEKESDDAGGGGGKQEANNLANSYKPMEEEAFPKGKHRGRYSHPTPQT